MADSGQRPCRAVRYAGLVATTMLLAGCEFGGLNSVPLPGTAGHGAGAFEVTVDMNDVVSLPQNSPVMVNDVTVGSVAGIKVVQRPDSTVYAVVRLALDRNVHLPANTSVKVAQTSLLGSQHIELATPTDQPARGLLSAGSHIALQRPGLYPTTEEVLAALGIIVNNGNLGALQDITDEMYAAVAGRAGAFADLLPRLAELTAALDAQTADILAAISGLDRATGVIAHSTEALHRTLATLPAALDVLNKNGDNIIAAFTALRQFATTAERVLSQTKADFAADMKDLYPIIKALNDNADDLIHDLRILPTFPFDAKYLARAVRGDYLNVFSTFDLTVRRVGESLFTTSALDPNMLHLAEVVNPPDFLIGALANLSGQAADPFKIPPGTATQHGTGP